MATRFRTRGLAGPDGLRSSLHSSGTQERGKELKVTSQYFQLCNIKRKDNHWRDDANVMTFFGGEWGGGN